MPYGVDERRPDSLYMVPREQVFVSNIRKYLDLFWKLRLGDPPQYANGLLVDFPEEHSGLGVLQAFLDFYVFSFMKYFDANTSDDDPKNVYMEREWRVVGDVGFDLNDVYRVILPRSYAERFRRDLPEYTGQVTFVESVEGGG
jgi:hypothetical protein